MSVLDKYVQNIFTWFNHVTLMTWRVFIGSLIVVHSLQTEPDQKNLQITVQHLAQDQLQLEANIKVGSKASATCA